MLKISSSGEHMGKVKVRYLIERRRKTGVTRYWWPTPKLVAAGFHPRRLKDDLAEAVRQAEAFNAELDAWYRGEQRQTEPSYISDGLRALDDLFQHDDWFRDMSPRTQRDYLYNIKPALKWAEDVPVRQITMKAVRTWYRAQRNAGGNATSPNRIAALRLLLGFGKTEGWLPENPAAGLRVKTPPSRSRIWTIAERDAFCAAAREAGRPSMALAVMLGWCLGQRPADLRTMAWTAYDGQTIRIRQAKTNQAVGIPVLPELRALLTTTERRSTQMFVSENTGRPCQESDFQHTFAEIRDGAGLPADLQYRDLRRTLATALGAADCSEDQIRSITGHRTREVLKVYVRPDDTFAKGAMGRLQRAHGDKS
jgi:integrase